MPQPRPAPTKSSPRVPTTLWSTGTTALDPADPWPHTIITRAIEEFSQPGSRILLTAIAPERRCGPSAARPRACTLTRALERITLIDSTAPATASVDLIVAGLLDTTPDPGLADRVAALATERLASGGVLVVLTRCSHTRDGLLLDPTGTIVRAAQSADLLYLQHIVAAPVLDDTVPAGTIAGPHRHLVSHVDISVFLQPATTQSAAAAA